MTDTTLEERVSILEFQVTEDVTDLGLEVTDLVDEFTDLGIEVTDLGLEVTDIGDEVDVITGEIAVIFTGQVIQDERILELEADSEGKLT